MKRCGASSSGAKKVKRLTSPRFVHSRAFRPAAEKERGGELVACFTIERPPLTGFVPRCSSEGAGVVVVAEALEVLDGDMTIAVIGQIGRYGRKGIEFRMRERCMESALMGGSVGNS
jgi:hypothetical protein